MHDELTEDYRDMIYAETAKDVEKRRKWFPLTWRVKCPDVAASLEECWRRIKTQTALPSAETAPALLWALVASGQIQIGKSAVGSVVVSAEADDLAA